MSIVKLLDLGGIFKLKPQESASTENPTQNPYLKPFNLLLGLQANFKKDYLSNNSLNFHFKSHLIDNNHINYFLNYDSQHQNLSLISSKTLNTPSKIANFLSWDQTNIYFKANYNLLTADIKPKIVVEEINLNLFESQHLNLLNKFRFMIDLRSLDYWQFGEKEVTDWLKVGYGLKSKLNDEFFQDMKFGYSLKVDI